MIEYTRQGEKFSCDILIKINADCPLIDIELIENGINLFMSSKNKPDLVTNCVEETFPEGMQYSIFNFSVIKKIWLTLKESFWREYFYRFMLENKKDFSIINIKNDQRFI